MDTLKFKYVQFFKQNQITKNLFSYSNKSLYTYKEIISIHCTLDFLLVNTIIVFNS